MFSSTWCRALLVASWRTSSHIRPLMLSITDSWQVERRNFIGKPQVAEMLLEGDFSLALCTFRSRTHLHVRERRNRRYRLLVAFSLLAWFPSRRSPDPWRISSGLGFHFRRPSPPKGEIFMFSFFVRGLWKCFCLIQTVDYDDAGGWTCSRHLWLWGGDATALMPPWRSLFLASTVVFKSLFEELMSVINR